MGMSSHSAWHSEYFVNVDLASIYLQGAVCFKPGFCILCEIHKNKWYYMQKLSPKCKNFKTKYIVNHINI